MKPTMIAAAVAVGLLLSGCTAAPQAIPSVTRVAAGESASSPSASPTSSEMPKAPSVEPVAKESASNVETTAAVMPSVTGKPAAPVGQVGKADLRAPVGPCQVSGDVVMPPDDVEAVCSHGAALWAPGTTRVVGHSTRSDQTAGYLERWIPAQKPGSVVRFAGREWLVDGAPISAPKGSLPTWVFSAGGSKAVAVISCDQSGPRTPDGKHTLRNLVLRLVPVEQAGAGGKAQKRKAPTRPTCQQAVETVQTPLVRSAKASGWRLVCGGSTHGYDAWTDSGVTYIRAGLRLTRANWSGLLEHEAGHAFDGARLSVAGRRIVNAALLSRFGVVVRDWSQGPYRLSPAEVFAESAAVCSLGRKATSGGIKTIPCHFVRAAMSAS